MSHGIAMLRASHCLFPVSVKLRIYYALIYSRITYCLTVWFNAAIIHINDVAHLQMCAIRLVVNAHKLARSKPIAFDDQYCCLAIFTSIKLRIAFILYCITRNLMFSRKN